MAFLSNLFSKERKGIARSQLAKVERELLWEKIINFMKYRAFLNQSLISLVSVFILVSCQEKKRIEISEPEKTVNHFIDLYKKEGPKDAMRVLLAPNKYISSDDSIGIKLQNYVEDLGDLQGFEKIRERAYGQGIVLLTYIVKYSRQPIRFNFKFYQPGNGWRIQNFSYETDFIDELDETVKPAMLRENYDTK